MSLLDDETLWRSSVVANCAMNRERGLASYRRELGADLSLRPGARWEPDPVCVARTGRRSAAC
ncbi:hypothetical protein ACFOWZ_24840 [Lentzea rhizosphaerae]|uniref:Uncharacterized protein n=1 Tax=Lentzea rhizosphaerae TaxID=2041025 RepID=A0ABV8BYA3_9PSEU